MIAGLSWAQLLSSSPATAQKLMQPDVPCTCRYKGADYSIGDSICLGTGSSTRMATCSMVLNNTSWQMSNAPCPQALLLPPETTPAQFAAPSAPADTPIF